MQQGLGNLVLGLELAEFLEQHLQVCALITGVAWARPPACVRGMATGIAPYHPRPLCRTGRGPRGPGRKKVLAAATIRAALSSDPSNSPRKPDSFPLHRKRNRGSEGTGDWFKNWIWTQGSLNPKSSALSCTPALKGPNVPFCSSFIGMSPSPPSPKVTKRPGTANRSWLPTASRKES